MKIFINGTCQAENIFTLIDPTSFSEAEFEAHVKAALSCVYNDYYCIPFRGAFEFDGEVYVADLALIHKSFSHWFIIEVELVSHSLQQHVVPQVRCFEYGVPQGSCVSYITTHIPTCTVKQAWTLLRLVPRSVAVVANRIEPKWIEALKVINVQVIAVSVFTTLQDGYALETEGSLNVPKVSLGFFAYSAPNRSIRVPLSCDLPQGMIQIEDPFGNLGFWTIRSAKDGLWITKDAGDPGIPDGKMVQILRTQAGKITLR